VGLLDQTDDEWLARLTRRRSEQADRDDLLWKYYDNAQPSAWVARILQEQEDRFPEVRINWSELVISAVEERLDVEGFRLDGEDDLDETLAGVWQDNDLDETSGEAHTAAMVCQESYIMLGPPDEDSGTGSPLVTVEYSDQVAVEIDPGTRRVVAALKQWKSDEQLTQMDMAQLQLPGRTVLYQHGAKGAEVVNRTKNGWAKTLEEHQTSPLVPVVPMRNRPRRGRGYSELADIIPLVNGVNLVATDMLAGVEHHALPRRWALNLDRRDFVDDNGNPLPACTALRGPRLGNAISTA
jgi:hypothetical protein